MPIIPHFFAEVNFRYCPDYFRKKVFGPGFSLQMFYLFKKRKLGAFLARGRQYRRMGLVAL